jgi:prophage regulatory protein
MSGDTSSRDRRRKARSPAVSPRSSSHRPSDLSSRRKPLPTPNPSRAESTSRLRCRADEDAIVQAAASLTALSLLRLPDVCRITGLSRAMIYRLQANGRFPKSVNITERAVGWIDAEIQAWILERASARQER